MKSRCAAGAVLAVATAVAVAACSGSSSGSGGGQSGASQPFVILDVTALSGPMAVIGAPEVQATKAAVNYLNANGGLSGHKIELELKDDQGDASTAVSVVQQALSSGTKPNLVLPGVTSNETNALLPLLARNGIVSIATTGSAEITDTAKYPLSFGSSFEPQDGPNALASYLAKQGDKTIGVLYADDAYGTSWYSYVSTALKTQNLKQVAVSYDPTAIDISPEMTKLDAGHPDVIVAEGFGAPVGAIYAARLKLGNFSIPMIADTTVSAGDPWATVGNPAAFANSIEQAYAVQKYEPPTSQSPAVETMLTWVKKLGAIKAAISLYAGSWDVLQTVRAAVAKAGSLDSQKLAAAMENLSAGNARWTQNGGGAPGYTSTVHFAVAAPKNYVFVKPGPLTDGMIVSQG
jgi:branched-chain amino acid transport system substrate-binding protein